MDFELLYGEAESLTLAELKAAVEKAGVKLADLSAGQYVSKEKYEAAVEAYKTQITEYDAKIKTFEGLNPEELKGAIATLEQDKAGLEKKLEQQAYGFKIETIVNAEDFTSHAAKKQFIHDLNNKGLAFEGDNLLGYSEFKAAYKESDPGVFAVEIAPTDAKEEGKPQFTKGSSKNKPAAMTIEDFNKLSTPEQLSIKAADPELFKSLLRR